MFVLIITAMLCSRSVFAFIDDPEGPNLLVVTVMAAVVYLMAFGIYLFNPIRKGAMESLSLATRVGLRRIMFVVVTQILVAAAIYFLIR